MNDPKDPLSVYQREVQSGRYHPSTEKNWPGKPTGNMKNKPQPKVEEPIPQEEPKVAETIKEVHHREYVSQQWGFMDWAAFILDLAIMGLLLFYVFGGSKVDPKGGIDPVLIQDLKQKEDSLNNEIKELRKMTEDLEKALKKKPKERVIRVTPPKVLKELKALRRETMILKENLSTAKETNRSLKMDKWREKLCYIHGDYEACLAYRKNIPWRARRNRKDL